MSLSPETINLRDEAFWAALSPELRSDLKQHLTASVKAWLAAHPEVEPKFFVVEDVEKHKVTAADINAL